MYRYRSNLQLTCSKETFTDHKHILFALEPKDEPFAEIIVRKHIVRARKTLGDS